LQIWLCPQFYLVPAAGQALLHQLHEGRDKIVQSLRPANAPHRLILKNIRINSTKKKFVFKINKN